jgi:GrpB-like predicted nucleotidyltransferase (UPF0157 family)
MTAPITIEDYNPLWPEEFEMLRSGVALVLDDLATAIEHVGSTAVPGLAAKPIIDIDILLRSANDLPLVCTRLGSLGYEHRGDLGVAGREAFRTPPGQIAHHLYVCPPGGREYTRHIAFRDYLRSHPEDASAYDALKRNLADKFAADREAYTQGKTEFVRQILRRAGQDFTP